MTLARDPVTAACVVLLALPAAAQQRQRPTLEQLLTAPFATELVAARAGGKLAWVENVLGSRNIWIAEPPLYEGRQLTRYTSDDGMYVVQLEFSPDANSIVFVRGGAHMGARTPEPPNPTLDPAGGREEVWLIATAGGPPSRIDDGYWPTISASGKLVAYLKRGQIWGAPLIGSPGGPTAGEPRLLIRDLGTAAPQGVFGNASSLRWSPRGDRLAFVSFRDLHSFVGIYDHDAGSLLFLDPSTDYDQEMAWSPDGARLAFVRVPSSPEELPGPRREALPWSLRVADARTGQGREIWRAAAGTGSAYWGFMNNERQLFWGADDRIAFPWERSGWVHLYSVPVDGGEALELTPGEFEVEHVALSPNRRDLIFSSNQGDTDRRHLWRVSIAGGPPQAVTSGTGIEYWPVVASDGRAVAFLASGGKVPPRAEWLRLLGDGATASPGSRRLLAPAIAPPQFRADDLVEPQQVIFPSEDGFEIHGQLFLPPDHRPGKRYPAIQYLHGGSRSQMLLGYHYHRSEYYQKVYGLNQHLAHQGYIVLSTNYRSGTGYGMKFREAEDYGLRGASEVRDVIAGGRYLKSRDDVDPDRIGLWGGSYGGYLTAMGLARASDLFAAGFDLHGVHSRDALLRLSPFSQLSSAQRDRLGEVARRSSPLGNVDTWRSPVLIVSGDDDRNVEFNQMVALVAALRRRGVEVELLVFPNEVHSFLLHSSWLRTFAAAADFFDRKLKQRAAAGQPAGTARR